MTDLEQRISNLEDNVDELSLELHASRVAITILSTVCNSLGGEQGNIAKAFEEGMAQRGKIDFDFVAPEGYQEKLVERISNLLCKQVEE